MHRWLRDEAVGVLRDYPAEAEGRPQIFEAEEPPNSLQVGLDLKLVARKVSYRAEVWHGKALFALVVAGPLLVAATSFGLARQPPMESILLEFSHLVEF